MGAHVLLKLLISLGNSDKMRGLPGILLLFRNEFNKYNTTVVPTKSDSDVLLCLQLLCTI